MDYLGGPNVNTTSLKMEKGDRRRVSGRVVQLEEDLLVLKVESGYRPKNVGSL